jgi:hypothetical protein
MNDADFHRTCNNLLYPPRRDPAPARRTRTVDDTRAEEPAIEAELRKVAKRVFIKSMRLTLKGKMTKEQFRIAMGWYIPFETVDQPDEYEGDECRCVLPEQSCPVCREAARQTGEIPYY